jgi:FtsP/CotA-like multicopper oxidase with cupredoxin domain
VQVNIAATASYAAGSATQDVTIALPTPTITFGAAPAATFPGGNFTVNATTNSNGALTYSWVGGPCAFVSGATFSPSGTGTCVVQASTAATSTYAAGSAQQSITITAGSSSAFDLYAVTGTTTLPGSITVPVWGYTLGSAGVITKPGGPVLIVNQNALVTITLHNNLSETTALLFQGQKMIPDTTGASAGGTHVYTFTASQPGTFLYEAGLIPGSQHQVAMGLYGTLIVRPADGASQAYANSLTSNTAFDAEQVLMLSELDVDLNNNPAGFDMRNYSPEFYLINGKAYPSTDPISVAAGNKVLLRYVNAGLQAHAMTTLGLTQSIIGQDGSAYKYSRSVVSETIATGQTLDTIVTVGVNGSNYPIYDASLFLRNNTGAGLGGMLSTLTVGTVTPPPPPSDTTGPVASALSATPNPTSGSDVIVTASISDVDKGNSNVDDAELYVDSTSGSPIAMTGTFGTPTVSVTGTIPASLLGILAAGDHTVYVRGHDAAGNWGNFATIILTLTSPAPGLNFSTSGTTSAGPSGVGADAADIYFWNGSAFSLAFDAPAGTNVDGYDQVGSIYYMSFAGDVTSPLVAQNEDVVSYDGATWSVFFDGTAYGLVASNIDAVSVVGGTLYFSTSDATLPAGVTGVGDDADIYSWNGSIITRVFDATAQGWSSNNVDGFVYVDADTFYLSYSPTSTTVAGLGTVQDEDVLKYDAGVWSVYFDGTAHGLTDTALDVDAFDIP